MNVSRDWLHIPVAFTALCVGKGAASRGERLLVLQNAFSCGLSRVVSVQQSCTFSVLPIYLILLYMFYITYRF